MASKTVQIAIQQLRTKDQHKIMLVADALNRTQRIKQQLYYWLLCPAICITSATLIFYAFTKLQHLLQAL